MLSPAGRAQSPAAAAISAWKASEVFAKGPLLLDRMASNRYQVFAVRRDAPGSVEHHALDTDIIMVLDGAATFVTEGVVTEPRSLRANEQSGSGIRDGKARRVARGDVIIVPNGTPHWFSEVSPAIRYFAVKLRQASAEVRVPPRVEYLDRIRSVREGRPALPGHRGSVRPDRCAPS